jgi:hypothetical protein
MLKLGATIPFVTLLNSAFVRLTETLVVVVPELLLPPLALLALLPPQAVIAKDNVRASPVKKSRPQPRSAIPNAPLCCAAQCWLPAFIAMCHPFSLGLCKPKKLGRYFARRGGDAAALGPTSTRAYVHRNRRTVVTELSAARGDKLIRQTVG